MCGSTDLMKQECSYIEGLDGEVYVAGAKLDNGKLLTNGGRVLGVTEIADTLENAIEKAYETVKLVSFDNAYYRTDIGQKALKGVK